MSKIDEMQGSRQSASRKKRGKRGKKYQNKDLKESVGLSRRKTRLPVPIFGASKANLEPPGDTGMGVIEEADKAHAMIDDVGRHIFLWVSDVKSNRGFSVLVQKVVGDMADEPFCAPLTSPRGRSIHLRDRRALLGVSGDADDGGNLFLPSWTITLIDPELLFPDHVPCVNQRADRV